MEELLRQLLAGQQQLFDGQKQLFDGQQQLFDGQKQLFDGQKQIINRLNRLDDELTTVKAEVTDIKAAMASKAQQEENNRFISALLHRTEELNATVTNLGFTSAKLEGMLAATASKEEAADLSAQLQVINERIFRQETEIRKLKAM